MYLGFWRGNHPAADDPHSHAVADEWNLISVLVAHPDCALTFGGPFPKVTPAMLSRSDADSRLLALTGRRSFLRRPAP